MVNTKDLGLYIVNLGLKKAQVGWIILPLVTSFPSLTTYPPSL